MGDRMLAEQRIRGTASNLRLDRVAISMRVESQPFLPQQQCTTYFSPLSGLIFVRSYCWSNQENALVAPCREVSGNLIGDCLRRETSMASGPRIAASKEGVPAMFGGVVSLNLINDFATNRTKSNMNPPTAVPYITEAGT